MKITKEQIRKLIQEEIAQTLEHSAEDDREHGDRFLDMPGYEDETNPEQIRKKRRRAGVVDDDDDFNRERLADLGYLEEEMSQEMETRTLSIVTMLTNINSSLAAIGEQMSEQNNLLREISRNTESRAQRLNR